MFGRHRLWARGLVWSFGLAVLLSACAAERQPAPITPKDGGSAPAPAAAAPAVPAASASGESAWTVAIPDDITSVDPASGSAITSSLNAQYLIYDPLVTFEGPTFTPLGKLAESWSMLDPNTWEFKLRRGVTFHNGDPFTAADVKYTYDLFADERSARRHSLETVASVEIVDPYTIRIITNTLSPALLANLSMLNIMPRDAREKAGEAFGSHPFGTGPYRFVEFERSRRLVLEANPTYWRGVVTPTRLTLRTIADPSTRVAELKTGGVDILAQPPLAQLQELQSGDTELMALKGARVMMMPFNTTVKPFDDPRVRQAVNYGVDRVTIVKNILEDHAELLHGPYASSWPGYDPSLEPYPYDPAKARQLLAEAGYPNGFEMVFNLSPGAFLRDREIAEVVANQLNQVGIKVQLVPAERTKLQEDWLNGNHRGITYVAWGTAADPEPMFAWTLYKRKGHTPDDRLNALIDDTRRVVDPEQRTRALREVGRYVHEQGYWLFIHAQDEFYAKRRGLDWAPTQSGQSVASIMYYRVAPR
jgi:peptide/nickel transport system substrate-binding protein